MLSEFSYALKWAGKKGGNVCEDVCVRLKLSPNRISSYLDAAAYLSGKGDLQDMRRGFTHCVPWRREREAKVSHSHIFKGTLQWQSGGKAKKKSIYGITSDKMELFKELFKFISILFAAKGRRREWKTFKLSINNGPQSRDERILKGSQHRGNSS